MEIKHLFTHVEGNFETDTGQIICVGKRKYGDVHLCFKANMHIPFAKIKLFSKDLAIHADQTFDDANNLGDEIAKRWNAHNDLLQLAIKCLHWCNNAQSPEWVNGLRAEAQVIIAKSTHEI